jgi:hypothetical protein
MSAHVIDPDDRFAGYHTPMIAPLDPSSQVKRALTELALINGPTDGSVRGATYHLRFVGESAGACLRADHPYLRDFLRRYADSWANVDAWSGWFTTIE